MLANWIRSQIIGYILRPWNHIFQQWCLNVRANAETGIGYDKREGNKKAGETPCGVLRYHGTAQIIWPYKWIFNWCWIYNEVMCQMPGYYQITIYSSILLIVFILRSKLFEDYQPRLAFSKKDRSWVAFPNSNRPIVTHFKQ